MSKINDDLQLRVAVYLRVSTEEQADKYGFDLQADAIAGMIKSKGKLSDGREKMVIAGDKYIYKDDISGTTPLEERPAFSRLKEDIVSANEGNKPFDIVAVYKIDRFARKLKILIELIDFFENYNIQFISANESIDTSTPFGKAMLGIIGIIAELEVETTKIRTQGGREEAIKKGVFMGSTIPYGFMKDINKLPVIFEVEANVVRLIFDKFVNERNSFQEIANFLTEKEYPTPEASSVIHKKRKGLIRKKNPISFWRANSIRSILRDEIYIGRYYYKKNKGSRRLPKADWALSPYKYPNIVDTYVFNKAQTLIDQSKSFANSRRSTNHIYLLSGLLKCDFCNSDKESQEHMITWTGDRKKIKNTSEYSYSYKCGRKNITKYPNPCQTIPIPAEPIEKYVIDLTRKLLNNPVAVYKYQQKLKSTRLEIKKLRTNREEIKKLFNSIPSRIERLKEQHELGLIDTPTLTNEIKELELKKQKYQVTLNQVEEKLAKNTLSNGYIQTLELFGKQYSEKLNKIYEDRREISNILRLLIDKIIIFSRPATISDSITGRKKEKQQIPYKIEIKLRLPQDLLQNLLTQFGVKNVNL